MEMSLSEPAHKRVTPPPGPFGYSLLSPQDTPYESAPEPPPGPALLDDSESNMLDNFFTSLNASHFDNNSDFWLSLGDQNNGESGAGFNWPDLPPTFEGSTTSLPPRSLSHNRFTEGATNDRAGPLSSDVLAAASMLYQNGINGNDFVSTFNNQIFTDNGLLDANGHSAEAKRAASRYPTGTDGTGNCMDPPHKGPPFADKGVHTNKMVFDPEAQNMLRESGGRKVGTLQWGSDARFADQGYHVPPDQPSVDEFTSSLLDNLKCLEAQPSAANTRPSSPVRGFSNSLKPESNSFGNANSIKPRSTYNNTQIGEPERPKKRRKSSNKIKEEDLDLETALGRSSNDRNIKERSVYDTTPRKPKVSAAAASKQPRENLSEAQKRTNHILSEQKRRNLIKQGFDELCAMVPELKGGGYSKSTMLTQTADWLEDLLHGNELLKAQLAEMKARTGG